MELPKFEGKFDKKYKEALKNYLISFLPEDIKNDEKSLKKVVKAYNLAFEAHKNILRKAEKNTPYIVHPIEVTKITILEMGQGLDVILAALLHDFIEDADKKKYPNPYNKIKTLLGKKIAEIVEGVTKVTREGGNAQIDTYKKMIYSFIEYPEVILVKIADRLHNMRTMEGMPEQKQRNKSLENLKIYATFAHSIGLYDIKKELENLSFKYLYPDVYKIIKGYFEFKEFYDQNHYFKFLENVLQKSLSQLDVDIKFTYEYKSLYTLYTKAQKIAKSLGLEEDSLNEDILRKIHNYKALRIVVDVDRDEIIPYSDEIIKIIKNELKNNGIRYIGNEKNWLKEPKKNGFRARIFTISYQDKHIEIQILTKKDEIIAKRGFFKVVHNVKNSLKQDLNIAESPEILIERLKDILQPSTITVFTPKGDKIVLPKGSYILDFAYKIHSDFVKYFIGAKVKNGTTKEVSYKHELQSGETIYIITNKDKKITIQPEWLGYAHQTETIKFIKRHLKKIPITQNTDNYTLIEKFTPNKPFEINDNFIFKQASCCHPIPYDSSYIFPTINRTGVVHKKTCKVAKRLINSGRPYAPVRWNFSKHCQRRFKTFIKLQAVDTEGILKKILDIFVENNINMHNLFVHATQEGGVIGLAEIEVKNKSKLNNVIDKIKQFNEITDVKRLDNYDFDKIISQIRK